LGAIGPDKVDLEFVNFIGGGEGGEPGQLDEPVGLAMWPQRRAGEQGAVMIVEGNNNRISEFALTSMVCFSEPSQPVLGAVAMGS
jgi:hypothetical protein